MAAKSMQRQASKEATGARRFLEEDDLDIVTSFRELVLAGWHNLGTPRPVRMKNVYPIGELRETVELVGTKSMDTRPDGSPWMCPMDRIMTPPSLDDLGEIRLGRPVENLLELIEDTDRETLPFCVCPATRTVVMVQHKLGFKPTQAPFMFVSQRQEVERVVAVPWADAWKFAETLPEATNIGPVLVIEMTGRCGSTALTKAFEWLDIGCQSVSEPVIFADVHEMLERDLCTESEAVDLLRAAVVMLVHQRRMAHPDKSMIIIKNRTLLPTWRAGVLLRKALPDVKRIFQWRRVEDVVGSFDEVLVNDMVSPIARLFKKHGLDSLLWKLNGNPQYQFMKRQVEIMRTDPLLAVMGGFEQVSVDSFLSHGSLGFVTLMSMMDAHIGVVLGQHGLWDMTVRYEDLMSRKSACVRDVLARLDWLQFVPNPEILGTPEGDKAFLRDAHSGGGLSKASGSTCGGNPMELAASQAAKDGKQREIAHLSPSSASVVRELMKQHSVLSAVDYELGAPAADRQDTGARRPTLLGAQSPGKDMFSSQVSKKMPASSLSTPEAQRKVLSAW
eukprot:TRINITY_DN2247_c0_g1_i1.p1 TRINITY_DN2247_c0_g1~~TRINITY_DN2247_c0_g1_i1.p1  ORF type:complete len:560 (+),score=110.38 TRINITY_DN2247_c0_g1_i1:97-1776(+)